MNAIDLTPVISAVVALAAALLSAFVIPVLRRKVARQDLERLEQLARLAVAAAEQMFPRDAGKKKRDYVLNYLAAKGCTVDAGDLLNALEAAVLRLHAELYGTPAGGT